MPKGHYTRKPRTLSGAPLNPEVDALSYDETRAAVCSTCDGAGVVGVTSPADNADLIIESCPDCSRPPQARDVPLPPGLILQNGDSVDVTSQVVANEDGDQTEIIATAFWGIQPSEATPSGHSAQEAPEPTERPWGWWTAWEEQQRFIEELHKSVPMPVDILPPIHTLSPAQLQDYLQRFGGALTNLYYNYGIMEGKVHALDATFKNAMIKAKFHAERRLYAEKVAKSEITEGRKEQEALNDPEIGEALREVKRRSIELETCLPVLKRYIDAYEIAWRTISRQMTGQQAEMELERSGRAN